MCLDVKTRGAAPCVQQSVSALQTEVAVRQVQGAARLLQCTYLIQVYTTTLAHRCRRSVSSRASTSNPVNLNRPEGVDTDTYQKCLQAAIDLQERGWAIVDNVFSQ